MLTDMLMVGAGGHGKVVIDAVRMTDPAKNIYLVDQNESLQGKFIFNDIEVQVLKNWAALPPVFHVSIGDNSARKTLTNTAIDNGKEAISIIHPDASVSENALLGSGVFVAAKTVIAVDSSIHDGCIINHGSVIDHDCLVGSFSHIAPNATLGGGVYIGGNCLIGSGSTVLPNIKIGYNVTIGAGSVVTCNVPDNQVFFGSPARFVSVNG